MRSPKNLTIVLLLLTTLGCATICWRQYQELITLRAGALQRAETPTHPPAPAPVAAAPVVDVEPPVSESAADIHPATDPEPRNRATERGDGERQANNFARMMERPEVQRLIALQRKAELDSRYANLFRELNLRPDQLDAFKNLLVDKSNALMDVRAAAREQGVDPRADRETYRKLINDAQTQVDESIRAQLGDAAYHQYKNYEATLPQRAVVDQLQQRLSYSSTPLTQAQSSQLVQLLASSGSGSAVNPSRMPGPSGANRSRVNVTDATINQALGLLAAPQVEALRQIQQEQQLQTQLSAAMRAQYQNRRPDGPAAPGGATTAPAARPSGG